jgi:tetratricopeptide (TPR) repeat protein
MLRLLVCACALAALLAAAPPAAADDSNTEAAKIHYKAGEQYYVKGHYEQAIAEFSEAYRLVKAAALLYNISQAYERMGDLRGAREHLLRYLDSGEAEPGEVQALREKLQSLDRRISEEDAARSATTPPPPAPTPVIADEAPPRPYRTWKWVAGGTGAGMLALGILFGLDAKEQERLLEEYAARDEKVRWADEPTDIYARGQRSNGLAIAFGLGGAALATTGVVLFYLDSRSSRERPAGHAVTPLVGPGLAGAAAVLRF